MYRKRSYRRKSYGKKPYRKKTSRKTFLTKSKFAKNVKSVIARTEELKYLDFNLAAANGGAPLAVSATGTLFEINRLSLIGQGTDINDRVGNKIFLRSLHVRGNIYMPSGIGADSTNVVRLIFFQWKQLPAGVANINQILYNAYTLTYDVNAMYNTGATGQFHILKDVRYSLTSGGRQQVNFDWNIKKNLHKKIEYFIGTNNVNANQIFMIAISDSAAAQHPTLEFDSRLKWTDA